MHFAEGQNLLMAALSEVVARITAHDRRQGFPLARAIVPGQTLVDSVLQVQVIEARYAAATRTGDTTCAA
jgi:hemolysin activation/secretion protein